MVILTFESVDEILECDYSNEIIKYNFPVVLSVMLYKVAQTILFLCY